MSNIKEQDYKIYTVAHWNTLDERPTSVVGPVLKAYIPKELIQSINENPDKDLSRMIPNTIQTKLNLINSLDNIKTIHRFPDLSLSRDKVKMWTDANDAKVIRDADKADLKIISIKSLEKIISNWWRGKLVTKEHFCNSLLDFHTDNRFVSEHGWSALCDDLNKLEDESLILVGENYRYGGSFKGWKAAFIKWCDDIGATQFGKTNTNPWNNIQIHVPKENYKSYKSLLSGTFMLDTVANKLMSTDSVTFDDEMFVNIKNMIKSGNDDDVTMAMTTVANCNIETSMTYLCILFFHYNETYFKFSKFYNSVSFKGVRKIFQKYADLTYQHSHASPYTRLVNYMLEDNALTTASIEHVLDLVYEKVVMGPTGISGSDVFTIERSSLVLDPALLKKLKENEFIIQ